MTPASWERIKGLFDRLRSMSRSRRQAALLQDDLDASQRAAIDGLLACDDEMGSFLERAWMAEAGSGSPCASEAWPDGYCVSGRYRVIRHIGRGGMGDVYEADDLELPTRVALKRLRPEAVRDPGAIERLRREVDLARRIAHPNVCRIFDLGRDMTEAVTEASGDGTLFLSMELLDGETLESRIARSGPLRETEAFTIASHVCAGLEAAHAAGVIHRDLKTSNVMLVPAAGGMRAVITDFGLACRTHMPLADGSQDAISDSDSDSDSDSGRDRGTVTVIPSQLLTRSGDLCGTPHYMAPEQVAGDPVGPAADIFALGVLLYRLISARYPFDGANAWQVMVRRLTDPPARLRDADPVVSSRWEPAIARCLARDPRQRPAHARDVIRQLDGGVARRTVHRRLAMVTAMLALCTWPDGRAYVASEPLRVTRRVAVLPFALTGAERPSALADGIGESVSARLDELRRVDAHLSSVPYADLRAANVGTLADARRLFGINLAVTGTLRSRGSAWQVRLRLLDASTGRALREQEATLDGDLSALARPLASLLDMPAAGAVAPSPTAASIAPGAYEFYTQGQGYLLRSGERDIDSAIDLLRRAVDTQPTFALAQAALARAYAKHYQRAHDASSADRAQQAAAEALRLDPSMASAHAASGMVLRQAGRREEAVRAFQAALQIDGQDADVLNQLANTYDELGDPLRAEETFQRAIRANPGYWVGYNNLGRFYLQHRQFEQARQQFRWATELAPDNPRAHSNLGGLYLAQGDYANAQTTLQRAYALQPTAAICSNLGTASLALGDNSRAQRMFEQAVSLAPRDHRYRRNLGDAYAIAGRLPDARAAWTQAATMIEVDTASVPSGAASADLYATAALYRAKLRETAATRRWLADAVRLLRPDDAGAQLKIAQAQELIGDRDAALATLTRAIGAGLARAEIDQSAELAQLRQDRRYAPLASPLATAHAAVAP